MKYLSSLTRNRCPAWCEIRTPNDSATERRAVEIGILGQWKTNLLYANHPAIELNIEKNGYLDPLSFPHLDHLALHTVQAYLAKGLIKKDDVVIDVGSGLGLFPKHLAEQGIEVAAIDPGFHFFKAKILHDASDENAKLAFVYADRKLSHL